MKKILLNLLLAGCVLFLCFSRASAATTLGNASATGLASGTLSTSQTGIAILGFSIRTTNNTTFTTFSFQSTQTIGNIGTYFSNVKLYRNTTANTFSGASQVTSGVVVGSLSSTTLNITVNENINNKTYYYFIVADYTVPSASDTFMLSLTGVTGKTGTINGPGLTLTPPVTLGTTLTTGLATGTINKTTASEGILGFSVTTLDNETFTSFQFSATQTIGTYFSAVRLYSCSSNNYSTGTKTLITTITGSALNTTSLTISGLTQTINTGTKYYFIQADFTDVCTTLTPFELDLTTASTASVSYTNGGPISGSSLTLSPPVTLGTALTTGLATGTLTTSTANEGILGFGITTADNETITSFQFSATQTIGTYFSAVRLYSCSSNNYSTGTKTLITTITGSALNTTSLTISGLTQTINTGTKYYFIQADYVVASSASTSFELDLTTASTASVNYTYNGPIAGSSLILTSNTCDWVGGSGTTSASKSDWGTAANWKIGGVTATSTPGLNDIIQIGVNNTYTYTPTISTATTVGEVNFGSKSTSLGLIANAALTVNGDISTASAGSTNATVSLSGTGSISAVNLNIASSQDQTSDNNITITVNSSVSNLNLSGNLTTTTFGYYYLVLGFIPVEVEDDCQFELSGGTTNIAGFLQTANTEVYAFGLIDIGGSSSTFTISPGSTATLNLQNANALSGLNSNGDNTFNFDNTGSLVEYTGANQTIYTSGAANTNGGVSYKNLTISGSGTETVGSGTLTVDGNLINSATTSLANNPTVNIGGTWTNSGTATCGTTGTITVGGLFSNTGTLTCGGGNITFEGGFTNSATFTASTGTVNFTGTQTLTDNNTTTGTVFNKVAFTSGTSTMAAGSNFAVSSNGLLTMSGTAQLVAGTTTSGGISYLTLRSDANGSANVAAIPSGASITGNVNVQRYLTGETSGTTYRSYRLLSSPVNISSSITGTGNLALNYINTNSTAGIPSNVGAFTAGPGGTSGGYTAYSAFPTLYIYNESLPSSTSFTGGKDVGISSMTSSTVTTVAGGASSQTVSLPVGTGYFLYFIGDNTSTNTASTRVPNATTLTATGYLNQQSVTFKLWTSGSTSLSYANPDASATKGFNLVGNPYSSSIDLKLLYADNATNPVGYTTFYELSDVDPSQSYSSYNGHTGMTNSGTPSEYIASGQGFFVLATKAGQTLTFKEDQKVTNQLNTTSSPPGVLSMPKNGQVANSLSAPGSINTDAIAEPANTLSGLHLMLQQDSITNASCGIYFSDDDDDAFDRDDAPVLQGFSPKVYMSSFTSDAVNTSINAMGDYTNGKRIKLYVKATTDGLFNLKMTDIQNVDTILYNVFLIDNYKKDSLDMVRYKSYAFNIVSADTNSFGAARFVLAVERKPLAAYQLVDFTAQKVTDGVQVNWKTYNEGNYTGFVLQKQNADGKFIQIDSLQSNSSTNYSFIDPDPIAGTNIYRLKQNDINGSITFSSPVTVIYNALSTNGVFMVYPNPSRAMITVNVNSANAATAATANFIASIYNTSGSLIGQKSVSSNSWTEDVSNYKAGVYIIILQDNTGKMIGKSEFVKTN